MLGFRHKLPKNFFHGACDVHCHLLPGVDDGFPTAEKSLRALRYLERHGVERMLLTPHFMKDYPENTRETIRPKFEAFKAEAGKVCGIKLGLAAEYMLDSQFLTHFREGFLTMCNGHHVLCETSYMMYERDAASMLYEVMLEGFQPVIAHPERYEYATKDSYETWKDKHFKFQLNLLSLGGAYGKPAKEKARHLLRLGYYDFVGSDLHRMDRFEHHVKSIRLSYKEMERLEELMENNQRLLR